MLHNEQVIIFMSTNIWVRHIAFVPSITKVCMCNLLPHPFPFVMTISETFACLYIAIRTVVYHYTNLVYFEEVISPSQVEYFIKKGLFTTPLKFSMEFLKLYTLLYYEDSYILLHQFDQLCSYILLHQFDQLYSYILLHQFDQLYSYILLHQFDQLYSYILLHQDEIKRKSSPLKLLSQSQPNFAEMILGWPPSKIVSGNPDFQPRWPPSSK